MSASATDEKIIDNSPPDEEDKAKHEVQVEDPDDDVSVLVLDEADEQKQPEQKESEQPEEADVRRLVPGVWPDCDDNECVVS